MDSIKNTTRQNKELIYRRKNMFSYGTWNSTIKIILLSEYQHNTDNSLPAECTAIKIQAGFGHLLVSQALPLPISSSATFRVTSPGKKIVQTCLLNLVTPFLTLMLTPLKDLSISTNGLAILMPFFLAILLTTPQVSTYLVLSLLCKDET